MTKYNLPDYENYKKRLRCFKQYKELPEVKFEELAKKLYQKKYKEVPENEEKSNNSTEVVENEIGVFASKEEAKEAQKIFEAYISGKEGLDETKISLVKSLVNYEIQIKRINLTIIEETKKAQEEEKKYNPTYQIRSLNDLMEQSLAIRRALGFSDEKKNGEDPIQYFRLLDKKFSVWRENNQLSRQRVCPHCSKMVLWKMRVEQYDVIKHPFFKDKVLCNEWGWELFRTGKITSLDLAKILLGKEVKTDIYVKWMEEHIYGGTNKDPLLESDDIKESGE